MVFNAVFNPNNRHLDDLPTIYGYNAGQRASLSLSCDTECVGYLIAQDGTDLGYCVCESHVSLAATLGCLEDTAPERHIESFRRHYPDGYIMEYVPKGQVKDHKGLTEALRLQAIDPDVAERQRLGKE